MEAILETLGDWAPKTKDLDVLTEYVRNTLRRVICQQVATPSDSGKLRLVSVTLDPRLEDQINSYIDRGGAGTTVSMPAFSSRSTAPPSVRMVSVVAPSRTCTSSSPIR